MFTEFSKVVHARYTIMAQNELFVVDLDGRALFDKYLAAFPAGSNPMRKTRTEHDCQTCKQFIRRLGKVVGIVKNQIVTVWDDPRKELLPPYKQVAAALADIIRAAPIKSVFRTKERKFGTEHNYDAANVRYDHFCGAVADRHFALNPETKRTEMDAIFQVGYRGLMEIKDEDIATVLDLIDQNQLYRGAEHKPALVGFRELLKQFKAAGALGGNFVWANLDNRNMRFRNTVIGTLLVDLSKGEDLDKAVRAFEKMVAPESYKRPTAIISQKQVENAVQTLTDLGLGGAIYRRFAKLSDVSVNDVLFVDNSSRGKMKDGIAQLLESSIKQSLPDLKKATAIKADDFVQNVLPGSKNLSVFLENRHAGNFVSLTGGDGPERLFKWDNNFAWAYDGDVTDSVKQRVKAAGGNVNAKLRVSLSWYNYDDLDLHCVMPNERHIYFAQKDGILDVDMNAGGEKSRNAVENLAFNNLMDGVYTVWVNQYNLREREDVGFAIEVEFGGVIHQYSYPKIVKAGENIQCFYLTVKNGQLVKIDTRLTGGNASKDKWGVKTESMVPVIAAMYSPNYWGENKVGAKHLIFALAGCVNPEPVRGIFNEYLRGDLDKHRKVFEVLGSKTKCKPTPEQISGVGFTAARGDTVTVVVDGRRSYTLTF